jgi:hypothetical protein
VYLNGAKMLEETSVKISRDTKAQVIETVARGFAGVSPGARMMTVSVEAAVPSADFEVNPGKFMTGLQVVELTIFAAGRTLTSKGFFLSDNFSHATNSPSGLSFDFTGE